MRLLLLLVVGSLGTGITMWGLPRGGRAARAGVAVGVLALLVITADAFVLRPARLTDTGQPITGLFGAHLVTTDFLRLVIGLWGLESLVLVALAWLLGGLARLKGLLPATLAAITGGTVAMASADLGVGAAAAAATGLAALIVILAVDGPAAVAAAARELRVTLVAGAVLLAMIAVLPIAARLALIASGVGSDVATDAASSVAGPALGLITVALGLAVAGRWGMLPFHVRVSRLTDLVPPETLPLLLAWIAVPLTVVAFAAVDRLIAPLALPLATALVAHARGAHEAAADALGNILPELQRIGGSHAQRDIFVQAWMDASFRAGRGEQLRAMLEERVKARPGVGIHLRDLQKLH